MTHSFLDDATWYNALNIEERITLCAGPDHLDDKHRSRPDRMSDIVGQLSASHPYVDGTAVERRLELSGLPVEALDTSLRASAETLRARSPGHPGWLTSLASAYRDMSAQDHESGFADASPRAEEFAVAVEPLVRCARRRLMSGLRRISRTHAETPFDRESIARAFGMQLDEQIIEAIGRTMVLELNIARQQGILSGSSPEERYRDFIDCLEDGEFALDVLRDYPALARLMVGRIHQWVEFTLEFIDHLCSDWPAISQIIFPGRAIGELIDFRAGNGDRHNGGRSVVIGTFASGDRIVYKPRSLAVDGHVQRLLSWINDKRMGVSFRTLRVLERKSYGWMEFISAEGCRSRDQVRRFYERQGGNLAILYALGATDFHSENLIAAGEHPMLIDLESLFHPDFDAAGANTAERAANEALNASVLRIGLLPQRIVLGDGYDSIDLSGMGSRSEQMTPCDVPCWDAAGTDEMRLARRRIALPHTDNNPTLNGGDVSAADNGDSIVAGFTAVFNLLAEHADELLSPEGPVVRFAGDEIRVILRPTHTYEILLSESFHPDLLTDGVARDLFLDQLWSETDQSPHLKKVVAAERHDLAMGDIPIFTARVDSRDIRGANGCRFVDFLENSGMDRARRKLETMDGADLARQTGLIRSSLATLETRPQQAAPPVVGAIRRPPVAAGVGLLEASARQIGERLSETAFRVDGAASWIGHFEADRNYSVPATVGIDLYSGLAGIGLFLGYLGDACGEGGFTDLARESVDTLRCNLLGGEAGDESIGAFSGLGGVVYALAHLGALWDDDDLLDLAETVAGRIDATDGDDRQFDIVDGAAGAIAGLLALHHVRPSGNTLSVAAACGDHLLSSAIETARGVTWPSSPAEENGMTGFAHGAAGISWALAKLSSFTGGDRFSQAAVAAIAEERGQLSGHEGDWFDVADDPDAGSHDGADRVAWCHGAPGIGLARLHLPSRVRDQEVDREIRAAVERTISNGFGHNHCLCHGDLGNLDFLVQATRYSRSADLARQTQRVIDSVSTACRTANWTSGLPGGIETPGLMDGLSGIGYGLLRLSDPAGFPSVLTLEPPMGK